MRALESMEVMSGSNDRYHVGLVRIVGAARK